jgi:hypothetical protein
MANGRHPPLVTTRLWLPEIDENQDLVMALADRLRGGEPLGAAGLAMTSRLVHDRSSPLHRSGRGSLPTALIDALAALERGQWTAGGAGR